MRRCGRFEVYRKRVGHTVAATAVVAAAAAVGRGPALWGLGVILPHRSPYRRVIVAHVKVVCCEADPRGISHAQYAVRESEIRTNCLGSSILLGYVTTSNSTSLSQLFENTYEMNQKTRILVFKVEDIDRSITSEHQYTERTRTATTGFEASTVDETNFTECRTALTDSGRVNSSQLNGKLTWAVKHGRDAIVFDTGIKLTGSSLVS
ncbi:hypothetical protein J6590_034717 [Homalodisca vitripennis]|nr:hypothetical protein J6590_034717 [Homalodisca vitripennis]